MCNDTQDSKPLNEQYKDYIEECQERIKKHNEQELDEFLSEYRQKKNKASEEPLTIVKRTPVEGTAYDKIEFNREMTFSELQKLASDEGMVIHENLDSSQAANEEHRNEYIGGATDTARNDDANAEPNNLCSGKKEKGEPAPLPEIDSAKISDEMKNAFAVNEDGIRENIKKSDIHMTEEEVKATIERVKKRLEDSHDTFKEPDLNDEILRKIEADTSSDIANGYYNTIVKELIAMRDSIADSKTFAQLIDKLKQSFPESIDELPTLLYSNTPDMTTKIADDMSKPMEEWPTITQDIVDRVNASTKRVNDSCKVSQSEAFPENIPSPVKTGHVKGSAWCDESPKHPKTSILKAITADMPKSMVEKIIAIPGEYWSMSANSTSGTHPSGCFSIQYGVIPRTITITIYPEFADRQELKDGVANPAFMSIYYDQSGLAPLQYSFGCENEAQLMAMGPNARKLYSWITAMISKFYQH